MTFTLCYKQPEVDLKYLGCASVICKWQLMVVCNSSSGGHPLLASMGMTHMCTQIHMSAGIFVGEARGVRTL